MQLVGIKMKNGSRYAYGMEKTRSRCMCMSGKIFSA